MFQVRVGNCTAAAKPECIRLNQPFASDMTSAGVRFDQQMSTQSGRYPQAEIGGKLLCDACWECLLDRPLSAALFGAHVGVKEQSTNVA